MAVTFPGTATTAARANDTTPGSSITVAVPASLAVGEHCLFVAGIRRSSSAPTSWEAPIFDGLEETGIHNDAQSAGPHFHSWVVYINDSTKLAAVNAQTWTFTTPSVTGDQVAIARRVAGASALDFIDAVHSAPDMSAGSTAQTYPAVSPSVGGTQILGICAKSHGELNLTWTSPMTALSSHNSANATVQNRLALYIGTYTEASAGSTGGDASTTGSSRAWSTGTGAIGISAMSANAGPNQTVSAGETVTLDGTDSIGADTYAWSQDVGDAQQVIFDDATAGEAHFVAPAPPSSTPVVLHFTLDITGSMSPGADDDTVDVTVTPAVGSGILMLPMRRWNGTSWDAIGASS